MVQPPSLPFAARRLRSDGFESDGFEPDGFESDGFEYVGFRSGGFEYGGLRADGFESGSRQERAWERGEDEACLRVVSELEKFTLGVASFSAKVLLMSISLGKTMRRAQKVRTPGGERRPKPERADGHGRTRVIPRGQPASHDGGGPSALGASLRSVRPSVRRNDEPRQPRRARQRRLMLRSNGPCMRHGWLHR